jgi:hypothetical protein
LKYCNSCFMTSKFIDNSFIWKFLFKCLCAIFIISSLNTHVVRTNRQHLDVSKSTMKTFRFDCRKTCGLSHNLAPLCNSRPWRRHSSPYPCYATVPINGTQVRPYRCSDGRLPEHRNHCIRTVEKFPYRYIRIRSCPGRAWSDENYSGPPRNSDHPPWIRDRAYKSPPVRTRVRNSYGSGCCTCVLQTIRINRS